MYQGRNGGEKIKAANDNLKETDLAMIRIEILGDVIPAARPRFSGRRAYQPKRNVEYREQVAWAARRAMCGAQPMTGEICAAVKVYRRMFGDLDNFLKAIFDGMNQIVFCDDSQIVRCIVEKYQDRERPRAEIEISQL